MSGKEKSFFGKKLIFDSLFLTYSLVAIVYFAYICLDGLGVAVPQITQDDVIAKMGPVWIGILIVAIVMAGLVVLLHRLGIPTIGDVLFSPPHKKQQISEKGFFKSFWGQHLFWVFIVTVLISLKITETSLYDLTDVDGVAGAIRIYQGLIHANMALLPISIMKVIETIFIAFLATMIAIPISFVLSFLCAKNLMTNPFAFAFYAVLRTFLNITRSVEPLIWAIIFTVWVGVGPFAGMLALMIHSIASLTKQYSELVEDVSDGPIEGIKSTGANMLQVVWFAVVPQVMLPYIAFTIYRWDINVRMATVIGLVGGGGIGTLLIKYYGQAMWPEVGCIIIVIAAVVWLMDAGSAYIREALK